MRSFSLQHEPFGIDTPHDSVHTAYPITIAIPQTPTDEIEP